jgi:hypothetical protein
LACRPAEVEWPGAAIPTGLARLWVSTRARRATSRWCTAITDGNPRRPRSSSRPVRWATPRHRSGPVPRLGLLRRREPVLDALRHRTYNTPAGSLDTTRSRIRPSPTRRRCASRWVAADGRDLRPDRPRGPFIIEATRSSGGRLHLLRDGTGSRRRRAPNPPSSSTRPQHSAVFDAAAAQPGFSNPSGFGGSTVKFVHTGPMPKTARRALPAAPEQGSAGNYDSGASCRHHQCVSIGSFLFVPTA